MPLLQALQPCSAPLPQEELADSCPSEFPVSTPPQAARLQKARRTNSGAALAYFLRSLESDYCSSSLAASVLGNRKANELSRLLLLCPFLLLYLAMYIASYLPGGSGPHVLSRPDALGGESTFTVLPPVHGRAHRAECSAAVYRLYKQPVAYQTAPVTRATSCNQLVPVPCPTDEREGRSPLKNTR